MTDHGAPEDIQTRIDQRCTWCGDLIEDGEPRVILVRQDQPLYRTHLSANPDLVAAFHDDDRPCFTEARDYGWSP